MKKYLIAFLTFLFCLSLTLSFSNLRIESLAEGEYTRNLSVSGITATANGVTVENLYSDPVSFYEEASSGYLNSQRINYDTVLENDGVIYTANYPSTTTLRATVGVTEYACVLDGAKYVVESVNKTGDGKTYIPVGGFVLSLNESLYPDFAKVGDEISLGGAKLSIPTKAVESTKGKRIVVNNTNTTRSEPMVVYYDYQFGEKTGTNVFGTEITFTYDFDQNTFKAVSVRGFGMGDDSGSFIPDNSFVLSAYGEGYRGLLVEGELFSVGDEVKMVGFDFIRFGGTVVGEYHFINPTPEENPAGMETETTPFDAYRGENQTIIYKDGWSYNDSTGTGTNVYGYEAAVDSEGVVVELNVNVSKIPEGGYVVSGHGKGRDFIRSNMVLGATVVLDETAKTYSISTTLNSYYENLVTGVNSAVSSAQSRIQRLYDVDKTLLEGYIAQVSEKVSSLESVKIAIETRLEDPELTEEERLSLLMEYNNYQIEIDKLQRKIIVSSAESKTVSARAVWHRPIEKNYSEIEENLSMYKDVGINMILVETLYNGYSAFKSNSPNFPYNEKLGSNFKKDAQTSYPDYLSAFVACAKEKGIEVHAWVENFYVGTLETVPVVVNHPDWVMYNSDDTYIQKNEGGPYIFLDPANKEVQNALISYYLELFEKIPDVKGLNLDYIRYPVSDYDEDTGYTIAAMKGFGEKKGITFTQAQLADREKMARKFKQLFDKAYLLGGQDEADKNHREWIEYRTSIITEYVRRINVEVKKTKNILLSTSVFASIIESKNMKKQDWQTWFMNGWIDIATPMAYYTDSSDVLKNVTDMILSAGNNCYYYSGLASSYSGLPAWQNKEQIEASYNAGANGYVIFCSTQIIGHTDVQDVLKAGVNSLEGVLPHAEISAVLNGYFNGIEDRADRLYIPAGGMTEDQKTALKGEFSKILAMESADAVSVYKIKKAVANLQKNASTYAKGYSRQRIAEQLKELEELLDTKISLTLIESGQWNPEENKVRPTVDESGVYYPQKPLDSSSSSNSSSSKVDGKQDGIDNSTLIVIAVAVVVLIGSGVVLFLLLKGKKKSVTVEKEEEESEKDETADEN